MKRFWKKQQNPVDESYEKHACEEQGKLFVSGYYKKGTWVSGYCREAELYHNIGQKFGTSKESIDEEARRIVVENVERNAPEYLGFVSDMEFRPMKNKPNIKNGLRENARISGDTIYFDAELASNDVKFRHVLLHEAAHMIDREENGVLGDQIHNEDFFKILRTISGEEVLDKYKENGVLKKNAFN